MPPDLAQDDGVITHVKIKDGVLRARFTSDTSGAYWPIENDGLQPDTLQAVTTAKAKPGVAVEIPGGAWQSQSPPSDASAFPAPAELPRVPFQHAAGYCTIGAVLNAPSITAKQREAILPHSVLRATLEGLPPILKRARAGTQLLKPSKWCPHFQQDQGLIGLLAWVLAGEAAGELVVNVEATDGPIEHYLLLSCDNRLFFDTSPLYGERAHPLNLATILLMGIRQVRKAAKIANVVPRSMRA